MRCTAVELNPRVVDVCRQWFRLPPPSPGFEILGMNAQRFVDDPRRRGTVDVLCVDLYDHEAASPVLDSAAFYRACFDVLAAGGVMTVNLFGHNASFETSTRRIVAAFGAAAVLDGPADERRQHRRAGDEASHATGPGRACPACRKHRNSLAASGPEVAAHDAPGGPRGRADPNASRMKIRSDTDLSKAVAAAGIRAVPRPAEPAAPTRGPPRERRRRRVKAPRRKMAARLATRRPRRGRSRGAFERSISTSRPTTVPAQAIDLSLNVVSHGKLTWRTVLAWLREDKIVSAEDIERTARRFAGGNSAQHPLVRIGSAGLTRVGDGKVLDTETLTEWLAKRSKLPYMRVDPLKVDVGRVADVMSIQYAERRHALPLTFGLTDVTIATCEPLDIAWVREIEAHTRRHVKLVIVNPIEIARYTTEFYALSRSVRNATKMGESAALANFEQLVELGKSNKQLDANDSGVIQVVDWLWQYAFDQRASDIHLEPRRERSVIRFRIDGVMHTVYQLPPGVMSAMVARVKLLGRMDVIERRRPLDGRIKVRNPAGDEVEMRLSTLPTAFGEKMVMRIFDPDTTVKTLESLGFGNHDGRRWEELVARPHGIILVTGPTGSGKTTTLYSTLRRLATDEVNVCTIEDPIEMIQPAFNQTQVQPGIDLGFTEGLRALMRQDPDIIMVGEIRDLPTADMAIQASLTGHLVFSTLHTNDSASAITRLNDLGVAPYLIGSTLIGVLAQRLVRTLCPACKLPDPEVTRDTLHEVVKPWRLNGGVRPYKAVGCLECRMTGFRGRAGLFELLTVSDAARSTIQPVCDEGKLRQQALQDGLRPLRLAGAMKVAEGVTTLDEVLRATPAWE